MGREEDTTEDGGNKDDRADDDGTGGPVLVTEDDPVDTPPVMVEPVIGMGFVKRVEDKDVRLDEVLLDPVVEFPLPVIRVMANAGLAFPESPNRTMM